MTFAGTLLGVVIGIVLLSWVVNLIGRDRLSSATASSSCSARFWR